MAAPIKVQPFLLYQSILFIGIHHYYRQAMRTAIMALSLCLERFERTSKSLE